MSVPQWRPIPGYPGYEASSEGQIRSRYRVLKPCRHTSGYRTVSPSINGWQNHVLVHRLVAITFLGPIPEDQEVNYLDGDKANNRASNLEYVTRKGNMKHARRIGIWDNRGELNGQATATDAQVIEAYGLVASGLTHGEAAARVGVSPHVVSAMCAGQHWKHLGLTPIKRKALRRVTDEQIAALRELRQTKSISETASILGIPDTTVWRYSQQRNGEYVASIKE